MKIILRKCASHYQAVHVISNQWKDHFLSRSAGVQRALGCLNNVRYCETSLSLVTRRCQKLVTQVSDIYTGRLNLESQRLIDIFVPLYVSTVGLFRMRHTHAHSWQRSSSRNQKEKASFKTDSFHQIVLSVQEVTETPTCRFWELISFLIKRSACSPAIDVLALSSATRCQPSPYNPSTHCSL